MWGGGSDAFGKNSYLGTFFFNLASLTLHLREGGKGDCSGSKREGQRHNSREE